MGEAEEKVANGGAERRSAQRHQSGLMGFFVRDGVDVDLRVHNLSSGGGLLEPLYHCSLAEGDKLRIYLDSGYVGDATVCRKEEDSRVAVSLNELLPEKSACRRPDISTLDDDISGCFVRKDPIGLAECLFPRIDCRWGIPQCGAVLCIHPLSSQFPDADASHIGEILGASQEMPGD